MKCYHPAQSIIPPVVLTQPPQALTSTTTITITAITITVIITTESIVSTAHITAAANHTTTAIPIAPPSTITTSMPYPRRAVAMATATATSTNQTYVPKSLAETTSRHHLSRQTARLVLAVTSPAAPVAHQAIDPRPNNNRTKSITTTRQHVVGLRTANWPLRDLPLIIQCGAHCVVVGPIHQKRASQLTTAFASHPCRIRRSVRI